MFEALDEALRGLGFDDDPGRRAQLDAQAGEQPEFAEPTASARATGAAPDMVRSGTGLRVTGPYELHRVWRSNNGVQVVVEQNTDQAGTHPPLAIIDGPGGWHTAADPTDVDLVLAEAAAAGGDMSRHTRRNTAAALRQAGFAEDRGHPGVWVRYGLRLGPLLLLMLPGLLLGRLWGLVAFAPPQVVTNATKKALLDAWYSAAAIGAPATHHFGLSTTTPAEDGTNVTEPSGNNYGRFAMTANTTNFPLSTAADPTVKTNGTVITFPTASGSWGTVTHVTQHTASTAGSVTDWQALSAGQAISNGTTASIAASAWSSTLT